MDEKFICWGFFPIKTTSIVGTQTPLLMDICHNNT